MKKQAYIIVAIFGVLSTATAQLSTNNAVIDGGNFTGNIGGYITNDVVIPTSINGLTVYGNNVISNSAGLFKGADGFKFPLVSTLVADGGSGLYLEDGTNTIFGGTFRGGTAVSDEYEHGYGVYQQVNEGSEAELSLFEGIIHNGLYVNVAETNSSAELLISTNVTLIGSLSKGGLGQLSLQGDVSSSIQSLEIEKGTVQFEDDYELASGGQIILASNAVLSAIGEMDIGGSVVGADGAMLKVEEPLSISGSISQVEVIFMGASNRLELVGTNFDVTDATFFATNGIADTLAFTEAQVTSSEELGMDSDEGRYRNFERIELTDEASDIWELTHADLARTNFVVDGGSGTNDMLAWKSGGTYSNALFAGVETYNTGFELYGLSEEADTWLAAADDVLLGSIDARGGTNVLDFENVNVAAADIGGDGGLYQNFAGALLSSAGSVWDATVEYGESFYVDASRTNYTLSYENAANSVITNVADMGLDSGRYRNFNAVLLTGFADTWKADDVDSTVVSYIDAGNGEDILSGDLVNAALIGEASLYRNFEAVALTGGGNVWTISLGDDDLLWVDAQDGSDTLKGALSDSSSLGAGNQYRNFEAVALTGGGNVWTISSGDDDLLWVDAQGGSDTLKGALSDSSSLGAGNQYRNFEQVELTSGVDTWTVGSGDATLTQINAGAGSDTLRVNTDQQVDAQSYDAYTSFETLRVSDGVFDLGADSLTWSGDYIQEADATLSLLAITNGLAAPRLSAAQIQLTEGTTIRLDGESYSNYSIENRYTNLIVQATSTLTIDQLNGLVEAGSGFEVKDWYIDNKGIYTIFDRRSLADPTNGIFGSLTLTGERILREIDTLTTDAASSMIDEVFAQSESSDRYTAKDVNRVYQRSIAMPRAVSHQRNGSLRTLSERISERRMMLFESKGPRGVRAPSLRSQKGNALWFKGYSANGSASEDGALEGYDLTGIGSTIGFDTAIEEWVLGTSAGVFNQTLVMDESGEYSGAGTHVGAYVSYGIEGWFFEANAVLANTTLDLVSEEGFGLEAEYTASDASFYIGAGYIMRDEEQAWTPEAGLLIYSYAQDEAADTGGLSVPVELDSFTQAGMQMRLGLTGAFRRMFIGRELLTQVKLRWMNHITVLDEESDFRLAGGDATYQMALLNAPKSLVELGLGAQLRMNRSFSLLMGFDYETGGGYSANRLSAGVRYNF